MIITISGNAGSGKSTVAKLLIEKLNAQRVYVGGIRRELAKDMGMTIQELNEYGKTHPETDVDVDKKAAAKALELEKQGPVIVEGRVQFHFLPQSIKIYMKVDINHAATRIFKELQQESAQQQRNEGKITSVEQLKDQIKEREQVDIERYQKYYALDHTDPKHYDFIVDTTNITAEQATDKILEFINKHVSSAYQKPSVFGRLQKSSIFVTHRGDE
jgi:CMP/dCMP kinase